MKNIFFKRAFCFIFSIIFLFSAFLIPTSAAEIPIEDIKTSAVESDLQRMGFDLSKYQKDADELSCRLLKLFEFGYDFYGDKTDYGLYAYVWNPSAQPLDEDGLNSIQMQLSTSAYVERDGLGFNKYKLELCSYSTKQGYENVFYKFKVADSKGFVDKLSASMRVYDISGIELQFLDADKPVEYKVGGKYCYSGYLPYRDRNRSAINTLEENVVDRTAVDIELHPVTWKTTTSDKGYGYQHEVFSVYFSIPNSIIRDYGNNNDIITKGLVEIAGQFEEYRINGLVSDDLSLVEGFKQYLGKDVRNEDIPYSFGCIDQSSSTAGFSWFHLNYNLTEWDFWYGIEFTSNKYVYNLLSTFHVPEAQQESFTEADFNIALNSLFADLGYEHYLKAQVGCITGLQDYKVTSGVDISSALASYASNHEKKWLDWFSNNNELIDASKVYKDCYSIQAIDVAEINGLLTDAAISEKYFMDETYCDSFKDFVNSEFTKGRTTYVMRFAVRDYYSTDVAVYKDGLFNDDLSGESYYFEKTIFKNLDIFTFTFENEYRNRTLVPVVCSPVDVLGTPTPPFEPPSFLENIFGFPDNLDDLWDMLWQFLITMIILAAIVFVVCKLFGVSATFVINGAAKVIVWIFSLPFKFVSWLVGLFKGKKSKKLSKKEEKKKEDK